MTLHSGVEKHVACREQACLVEIEEIGWLLQGPNLVIVFSPASDLSGKRYRRGVKIVITCGTTKFEMPFEVFPVAAVVRNG